MSSLCDICTKFAYYGFRQMNDIFLCCTRDYNMLAERQVW